jgi:hypothetical protein
MTHKHSADNAWWLPVELEADSCWSFNIGPLSIYAKRQAQQWLLAYERTSAVDGRELLSNSAAICMPPQLKAERYMFCQSPAALCLKPVLMDRPVVVKTLQPVHIPPAEQTTLYISSPVSVRVSLQQPEYLLQEIAIARLSDTWFGPSTQVGELCYADKTHARYNKNELPLRPHRAITPVVIQNTSKQMLSLSKISIPVPYLAVYSSADGNLWTDPITLQHEGTNSLARFKTGTLSSADANGAMLISPARAMPEKHSLIRAFTHIFAE